MSIGFIIYAILLIPLAGYATFYLEYAAFQIFLMGLLLPIIMFILLRKIRSEIYFEIGTGAVVAEKDSLMGCAKIHLNIRVENRSEWLPLLKGVVFLKYENTFSGEKGRKKLRFGADCNEKQEKQLELVVNKVGDVKLTVEKVRLYDYLSIFATTILKKQECASVLVLPPMKEIYLEEESLVGDGAEDSDKYSPYKKGEDPTEIFDIREYEDGDKIQRIHWKLSYKKRTWMVKEYSLPLANNTVVFVDFSIKAEKAKREERIAKLVQGIYSISMSLLEQELPQRFVWYDCVHDMIREEVVNREEELLWTLQAMFETRMTDDATQLAVAYEAWDNSKPVESGLYLTVNNASQIEGSDLHVRRLCIIDLTKNGD